MSDHNRPPGISDQEWIEIQTIYSVVVGRVSDRELSESRESDLDEQFGSVGIPSDNLFEQMERVLSRLTQTERKAIELAFGLNDGRSRSYSEIAETLCIPEEEVEPLLQEALRKTRN